ncbi:MAG: fused MFS/spermidine synthase [Verrucomicrobiales bacterium]|nr:fused MFS/spermidine synthase [Verrucomicrobiales bacterium]
MKPSMRWLYPTAVFCLLLSGIAGLAYQVAWSRYLALFLGHTSYAVVAVLVAFMGGLALGNAWLGRYADRISRPLALYGWLELGIAGYAVVFPIYFEVCQQLYITLARGATTGGLWWLALKFAFGLAAILIPTTLMGGTLPILTKLVTRSLGELRARVAGLYFINSVGAVAGVMLADFWWIPSFGLDATMFAGAILNGVVGALALAMSSSLERDSAMIPPWERASGEAAAAAEAEAGAEFYSESDLRLAVAAAGLSGFVAMLYEVVWTRLLALALGSSTHAFSLMLVTFISGIAAGAWVIGRWRNLRRTFDAFGWAEMALAGTLFASMFFYHYLPLAFVWLGGKLVREAANYPIYQGIQFGLCFVVMFVPALCLGMTLPLASRVATSELARTGRSVGLVFSINTLGTVLGAALTGMVFLPALGLAKTFALGVGLNLALALVVLLRKFAWGRLAVIWIGGAAVVLVMGVAHWRLDATWDRAFSLGLWRAGQPPGSIKEFQSMVRSLDVRFHRDGAGATVAVHGFTNTTSGGTEFTLRVNGKPDASTRGDLSTQLLLGHIPLLLRTNAQDVMVIGIGSGVTCGAVLEYPEVRRVDAVEISPEVRDAARTLFAPHNRGALDNPRLEVVLDDAKSFLKASGREYDVIISEPSNPWMAGVAGVFTREFYETCRASLKERGLMVQWVHIYESNDDAIRIVLATFASVFPSASIWQTIPGDLVLVGSVEPVNYDLDSIQRRFDEPAVTADLRRIDLFRLPVLLGLQLVSDYNTPFVVKPDSAVHSDYFPVLEYVAEKAFFAREDGVLHETFNENTLRRPSTLLGEYLRRHPLTVTDVQSFALFHTAYRLPHPRILRSILERWRELAPDSTLVAEYSAKLDFPLPVSELEAQRMALAREPMMAGAEKEPEPLRMYSRNLMNAYRYLRSAYYQPPTKELEAVLGRLIEVDGTHRQSHRLRLAEISWDKGNDEEFIRLVSDTFLQSAGAPAVGKFDLDYSGPGRALFLLIETLWRRGQYEEARLWCQAARDSGYLDEQGRYYTPMLNMVVRKVEAMAPGPVSAGAR